MGLVDGLTRSVDDFLNPNDEAKRRRRLIREGKSLLDSLGYTQFTDQDCYHIAYCAMVWRGTNAPPTQTAALLDKGGVRVHSDYPQRQSAYIRARNTYLRGVATESGLQLRVDPVTDVLPKESNYVETVLQAEQVPPSEPKKVRGRPFSKTHQPRWGKG